MLKDNTYPTPIFLFSLPRSGSTLLQRIMAGHEAIATTTEPWLILGPLYSLKKKGIIAEYNHAALFTAVNDFCGVLPNGRNDYLAEIREFALRLYAKATPEGATYFLDKTPRYLLIIEDILELFPDAKFIFLWRSPLAVIASIIKTFEQGRWELNSFKVDLFSGLSNMITSWERHSNIAFSLKYEDLLRQPKRTLLPLFEYLDLPYDEELASTFTGINLGGTFGDKVGIGRYNRISNEPLEKWKADVAGPVRKLWCRRYLNWIGKDRLRIMGYDADELLTELDSVPTRLNTLFSDLRGAARPMPYKGYTV